MSFRTPLTLVVLVVLLVAGSMLGWRLLTEDVPALDNNNAQPACRDKELRSGATLYARQVTVNVYNSGSISGLASSTMRSLTRRGFIAGVVDNAPHRLETDNVLVLDAEPKSATVELVAKQFDGHVDVRKRRDDLSDGIDVVVGDHFAGLDKHAKTSLSVADRTDVCVTVSPTP